MPVWEKILDRTKSNQPDHDVFQYAAGFLLAGGESSRMGRDKALLTLDGESLAGRGIRKLREVCPETAIAGGAPELRDLARIIPDLHPDCGPLGGIVSALEQSPYEWNVFLAVDMPFVPISVLRALLIAAGGQQSVLVAEAQGKLQPLCAVYTRRALPFLFTCISAGKLKVKDAILSMGSYSLVEFDNLEWFRNLNTPDDFLQAQGFTEETR